MSETKDELVTAAPASVSYAFPKAFRLLSPKDFQLVFETRRGWSDQNLTVKVRQNGLTHGRLGLVTSRKCGRAVRRNRIRRVVREVFRLHPEQFAGWDVVVIARGRETAEEYAELEMSLLAAMDRLRGLAARRPVKTE